MLMKFENLARSESFLPDFLHNEDKYSLKFRFLSICKTSNFETETAFIESMCVKFCN